MGTNMIGYALQVQWPITAGAYPSFCSIKRAGVLLLLLDVMLVNRR